MHYFAIFLLSFTLFTPFTFSSAYAEPEPSTSSAVLDIDNNGETKALQDGLLILRYLFNFRGNELIDKALGAGATRITADEIESYINNNLAILDIDGNGITSPLIDGLLIIRYLFDFREEALIENAIGTGAIRTTPAQVVAYIESLDIDITSPIVTADIPVDKSTITDVTQPLSYIVKDAQSGVNASTLKIKINGNDRTHLASYANDKITVTPDVSNYWNSGTLNIEVEILDKNGNKASEKFTYTVTTTVVDTAPPIVVSDIPANGEKIVDITQSISYSVSDVESGINESTLKIKINGNDRTHLATYANDKITVTPDVSNYWNSGALSIEVEILDKNGNKAKVTFEYNVQPGTVALPKANPSTGDVPLTVQLIPFNTTNVAIETYEWDFDGDGVYDRSETVGRNQTYTFNTPGNHVVSLRITDSNGNQVTGTVTVVVKNAAPVVIANVVPSNGPVPLDVFFSVSAQDNEGIATYAWDFEGDGVYDVTGASETTANHTYSTQGTFQPALQVTDTFGVETVYAFSDIEVRVKPAGYPTVMASSSPDSGTAPLNVSLSANATPTGTRTITKYEWDFDGDGTYDETSATTGSTTHAYTASGVFFTKVQVTDSDNQTTEDIVKITVNPSFNLSVSTDTIDTANEELSTITTTLGGDTKMSLIIEDKYGNHVNTLVPLGVRSAGTYTDDWSGNNDSGIKVAEGEYRAVMLYEKHSVLKRFDLSTSTGGSSYNPSRTGIPSNFQPFAGNPLVIDFTLSEASEITAFMGRYRVNTRLVTFMQRRSLGKGVHRITWNGDDSTGQLIHPPAGDSFLFGIFGYRLPDNAIYVRSGAHIQDVAITPSIYAPDSVNQPKSKISFNLTGNADIKLQVYNADQGSLVASKTFTGLSTGENEVEWDGKNNAGIYVASGKYRLGVTAIDSNGFQSITYYVVQQVYH